MKLVDKVLDLSWLRDEVKDLYCCDNGRPCIDPEAAVRLMLAGFFQGVVHDRKLIREAQVNIAICWFAGYRLDEKLPDHSSLMKIRQRLGDECFNKIFQKTVQGCVDAGLVNGETVQISTGYEAHLRARRRHRQPEQNFVEVYKRHRWRAEGMHGEAKTQHGLRRAVRRGLSNVAIQAYLTAAVINLKRMAAFVDLLFAQFCVYLRNLWAHSQPEIVMSKVSADSERILVWRRTG